MTVTVPSSVGDLLRDTLDRDAVAAALPTVSGPLEELLLTRVLAAVDAVLDVDLACVLLDGWKTYGALVEAARRTQEPPAASETVPLHHQELTWTSHPSVEIFVNGKKVATLAFDLTVTADVAGVSAEVRGGRLVGLRGGDVGIKATLAMAGRTLAEREAPFPLGVSVPLGRGFPLLPGRRPGRSTPRRLRSLMIGAAVVLLAALVSIGVVAVGAFGSTPERAQPPAQISGAVKQGETRNVRAGPSNDATVIATVRSGDPVVVRCTTASGWMRLVSPHPDAYVYRSGLTLDAEPPTCA